MRSTTTGESSSQGNGTLPNWGSTSSQLFSGTGRTQANTTDTSDVPSSSRAPPPPPDSSAPPSKDRDEEWEEEESSEEDPDMNELETVRRRLRLEKGKAKAVTVEDAEDEAEGS